MEEQEISTQSDASSESSSEAQDQSSDSNVSASTETPQTKPTPESNVPFHEHPRFKELVEQKNRATEQSRALEQRYSQMEAQMRELQSKLTPKEEDALLKRLKGIDPDFASRFEKHDALTREVDELRQWKQQFEASQVRTQALSEVSRLHEQNRVSPELRETYNMEIQAVAKANPNLGLQDLPHVYKQVHDKYTKLFESVRRQDREQYVQGKKADSSSPSSQPRGKAVSPANKAEFSKDPYEARQQLIQRVIKQARASSDV